MTEYAEGVNAVEPERTWKWERGTSGIRSTRNFFSSCPCPFWVYKCN